MKTSVEIVNNVNKQIEALKLGSENNLNTTLKPDDAKDLLQYIHAIEQLLTIHDVLQKDKSEYK